MRLYDTIDTRNNGKENRKLLEWKLPRDVVEMSGKFEVKNCRE
jgi:hypothetical protein